jgi:hypothetical protein
MFPQQGLNPRLHLVKELAYCSKPLRHVGGYEICKKNRCESLFWQDVDNAYRSIAPLERKLNRQRYEVANSTSSRQQAGASDAQRSKQAWTFCMHIISR